MFRSESQSVHIQFGFEEEIHIISRQMLRHPVVLKQLLWSLQEFGSLADHLAKQPASAASGGKRKQDDGASTRVPSSKGPGSVSTAGGNKRRKGKFTSCYICGAEPKGTKARAAGGDCLGLLNLYLWSPILIVNWSLASLADLEARPRCQAHPFNGWSRI